jgi:hypothetical protein
MPRLRRGLTEPEYRKALRKGMVELFPKKGRKDRSVYNRAYNKARRLGLSNPAAHARAAMQEARDG